MTLSADGRKESMREALRLMLAALGAEHAYGEWHHEVAHQDAPTAPFQHIPPTTWDDLEAQRYVTPAHAIGVRAFVLTGPGWIAALKVAQQYNTVEQRQRVIALRRALVDLNKGRPAHGTLTSIGELVAETGLPRAWVTSAVYGQLLRQWFDDDVVELEIRGRVIRIPSRFGADRLDFDPDVS